MLAALTLALQKFNIQARRGAPGFREQRPRPRKRQQSGRKLPKRLRSHDSDRSRPTSPDSGSFYTPASTPSFSPFTTPPESPLIGRRNVVNQFNHEDITGNYFEPEPEEVVACQPVQSSAYISLSPAPQFINGYKEPNLTATTVNTDKPILPEQTHQSLTSPVSNGLTPQGLPVVQEDTIVAENFTRANQAPPLKQVSQPQVFNQSSQPSQVSQTSQPPATSPASQSPQFSQVKPQQIYQVSQIRQTSQPDDEKKVTGTTPWSQPVPVEEAPVEVVQIDRSALARAAPLPPPGVFEQQKSQESLKLQQNFPKKTPIQPKIQSQIKPPQIDAGIVSAFNRVQDYFDKHPEHKNLTHEQLVNQLTKTAPKHGHNDLLDQLAKDHQYLLRRFIEQQDSSDDESDAEERINNSKKVKAKRQRPADRRPNYGPELIHSTTQTDEEPEVPRQPERRPLRLPLVEDLVANQSKKRQQGKQLPAVPQKPDAPSKPAVGPKPAEAPKPVGKKAKAAKSYEQLVLELEPLVTPVSPPTAATAPATGAAPSGGQADGQADGRASLWKDVWGSWGVWLIARFSATGQGGDVKEASSEFAKDKQLQHRPTDKHTSKEATDIAAMPGPVKEINVTLYRDTLNTPWGFRLQGGLDFKQPLTVQRVFVGSPADQNLQRGDIIIRIGQTDVTHLTHKQAQDLVKQAGGEIIMVVKRASQEGYGVRTGSPQLVIVPSVPDPGFRPRPMEAPSGALGFVPALPKDLYRPQAPQQPTGGSFGQDYRRGTFRVDPIPRAPQPNNMLNRLNQSLNQSIWSPGQDEEDLQFKPVSQMKQTFDAPSNDIMNRPTGQFDQAQLTLECGEPEDQELSYKGVKELKKTYNKQVKAHEKELQPKKPLPADLRRQQVGPMSSGKIWTKPAPTPGSLPCGLNEPGWTAGASKPGGQWSAVRAPGSAGNFAPTPVNRPQQVPVNRPQPVNRRPQQQGYRPPHIESNEPPAWYGSLRSMGGVRPWEVRAAEATLGEEAPISPGRQQAPVQGSMLSPRQGGGQASPRSPGGPAGGDVPVHSPRVQQMSYGPSGQEYRQLAPGQEAEDATVQHLQYNTPIGLYSKSNVQAALQSQTAGKPGEGTMQVTGTGGPGGKKEFDPSRSEVLALLQSEERGPRRAPAPQGQPQGQPQGYQPAQSARYEEERPHYQGYVDHSKQSPSMHALEAHVDSEAPGGGFSDF